MFGRAVWRALFFALVIGREIASAAEQRFITVEEELQKPEIMSDMAVYTDLMKEYKNLTESDYRNAFVDVSTESGKESVLNSVKALYSGAPNTHTGTALIMANKNFANNPIP